MEQTEKDKNGSDSSELQIVQEGLESDEDKDIFANDR